MKMRKLSNSHYYIKCRECGWEGYTLLRGYGGNGYLYLECENCGARNLYINPPPKNDTIFIGGTILHDFAHFAAKSVVSGVHSVKNMLKNSWTWFTSQPRLRKFTLGGGLTVVLVFMICLVMFRTYFYHFLAATIGSIAGTLALFFREGE